MSYYMSINPDLQTFWMGKKCGRIMLHKTSNIKLINLIPVKIDDSARIIHDNVETNKQLAENFVELDTCFKIPSNYIQDKVVSNMEIFLKDFQHKIDNSSFNMFKSFNHNKKIVNELYVKNIQEWNQTTGVHLVLDAETMLTTHYLHSIGIDSKHVFIPNPNAENFKKDRYTKKVNLWNGMLHDFLRQTKEDFSSIFLDYCCTYNGNIFCKPKKDIRYIIENNILKPNGILGLTFCKRNCKAKNISINVQAFLNYNCRKHNRTCVKLEEINYSNMVFYIFKI